MRQSLSRKYSVFTGLLLLYVVFIFVAVDIHTHSFSPVKAAALAISSLLIAGAIAKYTNRLLARPLQLLQDGMASVRKGKLEPIRVSRTGDEIEFVGESFNAMIRDLDAVQREVNRYQGSLEERIRERTKALEQV